jgi:hypothetical protein
VRTNCNNSSAATAARRTQILARQLLPLLAVATLPLAVRSNHTAAAMSSDNTQTATVAGERRKDKGEEEVGRTRDDAAAGWAR